MSSFNMEEIVNFGDFKRSYHPHYCKNNTTAVLSIKLQMRANCIFIVR